MSAAVVWLALALASEPGELDTLTHAEPHTHDTGDIQPLQEDPSATQDISATIAALEAQLASQRAELLALRAAHNGAVDTGLIESGAPLIVRRGERTASLVGVGQDVWVRGHVTGDVTAIGSAIRVWPSGRVDGNAVAMGGTLTIDDGGVVHGDKLTVSRDVLIASPSGGLAALWTSLIRRIVAVLTVAGVGVLTVALVPDRVERIATRLTQRPVRSMAMGAFGTTAALIAAALCAVTLVGLPISIALLAALGLACMLGLVAICQAIGEHLPLHHRVHGRWLAVVAGTAIAVLVASLPIIGAVLVFGAGVFGTGAALSTRLGTR